MHLATSGVITLVNGVWQFARPRTLLLIGLHIVLAGAYLSPNVPDIAVMIRALLAAMFGYMSAVAINDLSDEEVDAINLPHQQQAGDRPLINKTLSHVQAWGIAIGSSVACVAFCIWLEPWLGLVAVALVALNVAYSMPPVQVSKRGGFAQALLPLMYVVFPFCLAIGISGVPAHSGILALMAGCYFLFVGRLFLKDFRDETGDGKVGKRTFLIRHGHSATLIQSGIWSSIGVVISLIAVIGHIGQMALTVVVGLVVISGMVWALRKCARTPQLAIKLLYIALMGRFASLWIFYVMTALLLSSVMIPSSHKILLLLCTVGIFIGGAGVLYEEIQATMRLQRAGSRRQE